MRSTPASYAVTTFTHVYHGAYGGPEVDRTTPAVRSVALDADGMVARIVLDHVPRWGPARRQALMDGLRAEVEAVRAGS